MQGTKNNVLTYSHTHKSDSELFTTFADANWSFVCFNGHGTGDYIVTIGSGAVSWSAKQQVLVCDSTTEAEYIAAIDEGK